MKSCSSESLISRLRVFNSLIDGGTTTLLFFGDGLAHIAPSSVMILLYKKSWPYGSPNLCFLNSGGGGGEIFYGVDVVPGQNELWF